MTQKSFKAEMLHSYVPLLKFCYIARTWSLQRPHASSSVHTLFNVCFITGDEFGSKHVVWSSWSFIVIYNKNIHWLCADGRARSEPGGTWWRTGGEVKGKLANGVGSQYSHATSQRGVSSITTADAHISAASSRLKWRPHRFKWTRPFRGKTKSGFLGVCHQVPHEFYNKHGLPEGRKIILPLSTLIFMNL